GGHKHKGSVKKQDDSWGGRGSGERLFAGRGPLRAGGHRGSGGGPWVRDRENMVRVVHSDITWPQDADIDEKFAERTLQRRLLSFRSSQQAYKRCAYFGINEDEFAEWGGKFVRAALDGAVERLRPQALVPLLVRSGLQGLDDFIVNRFLAYLESEAAHVVKDIRYLREISNMQYPHEWATATRTMRRRIIMHVGPTNSGKTHHALERLKEAPTGVYCSPLRLLAYEVYNRMLAAGVSCRVITGEDRRQTDFDGLGIAPREYSALGTPVTQVTSCTIEMAPNAMYDVAVVDEIQMISDRERGWAWTNALLNLRASEIHLCGEPSAVPLVKRICAATDEAVEVREYSRLGELRVSDTSLCGRWENVRKGDCLVVFSRLGIYQTKATVEKKTGMRCAVIYGGLPPEARVEQAKLFNDPDSGYDVLIASDAVGMGINLSIKRVVFMNLSKWDGEVVRPISVSLTRQIGGRAGRFGSGIEAGTVTAMEARDMPVLARTMGTMPPALAAAGIKPGLETVEMFSHQFPNIPFSRLWSMFCDVSEVDPGYFLCSSGDQGQIADAIEDIPLTIGERYRIIFAPVSVRDEIVRQALRAFASAIARRQKCRLADVVTLPEGVPDSREEIRTLEQWHRAITLYLWLSYHFPETFANDDEAFAVKDRCEKIVQAGLVRLRSAPRGAGGRGDIPEGASSADVASARDRALREIRQALNIRD
ncbi:RNA helicase, partial [Coemansia javaensis]